MLSSYVFCVSVMHLLTAYTTEDVKTKKKKHIFHSFQPKIITYIKMGTIFFCEISSRAELSCSGP